MEEEKKVIEENKVENENPIELGEIEFNKNEVAVAKEEDKPIDNTTKLVEQAYNQAIISQVKDNKDIQEQLLNSAEKTIKAKTNAIESKAEAEDKASHFNNHVDACECFGFDEKTTPKWAVNLMNVLHNVLLVVWIIICIPTIAPIVFVGKKINVIVKKTWIAMLVAALIYLIIAVVIPIVSYYTNGFEFLKK